jgi:hypothetical protein
MEYQEHFTKEEWLMFLDYEIIIKAANVNSQKQYYENQTNIIKLCNFERKYNISYSQTEDEIREEMRRQILSVITKLVALRDYHKLIEQLLTCTTPLASCVTASDFHKVILSVKDIVTEVEKINPRKIIRKIAK